MSNTVTSICRNLKGVCPVKITVQEIDAITGTIHSRRLTAREFNTEFPEPRDFDISEVEICVQNRRPKHQKFALYHDFATNTEVQNFDKIGYDSNYTYTEHYTTSGKCIQIYFPNDMAYPVNTRGEMLSPYTDYDPKDLNHVLGCDRLYSALIGRYFEITEDLSCFVFEPSLQADAILVFTMTDIDEVGPYFHNSFIHEKLQNQPGITLSIASLYDSLTRGRTITYRDLRPDVTHLFLDFWVKFELLEFSILEKGLPEIVLDGQNRHNLLPYQRINPALLQHYCVKLNPKDIEKHTLGLACAFPDFYDASIELETSLKLGSFPSRLRLLFPQDYHFLTHADDSLLNWREEYDYKMILNAIQWQEDALSVSTFLGHFFVKDGSSNEVYFVIDEAKEAKHLLLIEQTNQAYPEPHEYFYFEDIVELRAGEYRAQQEKYIFTIIDLEELENQTGDYDLHNHIYQYYRDGLTRYHTLPTTANLESFRQHLQEVSE